MGAWNFCKWYLESSLIPYSKHERGQCDFITHPTPDCVPKASCISWKVVCSENTKVFWKKDPS